MSLAQFKKDFKQVFAEISLLDKLLPVLIVLAMTLGILLSVFVPHTRNSFDGAKVIDVSIPLAIGLIVMMIPPFCKVNWESFLSMLAHGKFIRPSQEYTNAIMISMVLNWIVCPFLMFGLAWLSLFDEPEYRTGIIMVGLARCVAMVLVWNEIALGDNTLCTVLVLINSLLQVVLYAPYQIFFCYIITGDKSKFMVNGFSSTTSSSYQSVAKSVCFFLGIPLALGVLIRVGGISILGLQNYNKKMLKYISPWSLIGLLYTIIAIFIEKGYDFIKNIGSALRCFVPLVAYFIISWFGVFFALRYASHFRFLQRFKNKSSDSADKEEEKYLVCGCEEKISMYPQKGTIGCTANYSHIVAQTFTASSNNFELSLAIAISLYGSGSKQAIAATFGPLLEVPILLALLYVARYFRISLIWSDVE